MLHPRNRRRKTEVGIFISISHAKNKKRARFITDGRTLAEHTLHDTVLDGSVDHSRLAMAGGTVRRWARSAMERAVSSAMSGTAASCQRRATPAQSGRRRDDAAPSVPGIVAHRHGRSAGFVSRAVPSGRRRAECPSPRGSARRGRRAGTCGREATPRRAAGLRRGSSVRATFKKRVRAGLPHSIALDAPHSLSEITPGQRDSTLSSSTLAKPGLRRARVVKRGERRVERGARIS